MKVFTVTFVMLMLTGGAFSASAQTTSRFPGNPQDAAKLGLWVRNYKTLPILHIVRINGVQDTYEKDIATKDIRTGIADYLAEQHTFKLDSEGERPDGQMLVITGEIVDETFHLHLEFQRLVSWPLPDQTSAKFLSAT